MHTINLSNKDIHTDLIMDIKEVSGLEKVITKTKNTKVEELEINTDNSLKLNKKKGLYETITFKDITDKNNFKEVEELGIKTLKRVITKTKLQDKQKVLVIGLGNEESTPDALGPKTTKNILVTKHLFSLGEVEDGYLEVSTIKPGVTGTTGIETKDLVEGILTKIDIDYIIIIDALASSSLERLNKTIQITTTGISPGSGIGNNRKELSEETLNIPTIAIGIPTVVDATTIVQNTLDLILKKIAYNLENNTTDKLKTIEKINYSDTKKELTNEEKEKVLGMVGVLSKEKQKDLLLEVLLPNNNNMMVTPKEIDYLIDKLSLLLANIINKTLHKHFNPTN